MVGHSWPLIDKLWLVSLLVISMTCLIFIWLFGIRLYQNTSYLVQLCLIGFFSNFHFPIDVFRVLSRSSCSLKIFTRIGLFHLAFIFVFVDLSLLFFLQVSCTCYPYGPGCIFIHNFKHKEFLVKRPKYLLFPRLGELKPALWKYGAHCSWRYLNPLSLAILRTPDSSHHGSELIVLLNWMLFPLVNIRVPPAGAFSVCVEPTCIISGSFL